LVLDRPPVEMLAGVEAEAGEREGASAVLLLLMAGDKAAMFSVTLRFEITEKIQRQAIE